MKLLLVDGHYYAYRSFYAIRNLSNSKGEPTNALFGMAKALKKMLADVKPDLAAVVMDGGLPAHRLAEHESYKANRAETPDLLAKQIPLFQDLVPALGLACLTVEGEEADDVLASYAREAAREKIDVVLATNDKDLMQLVGDNLSVYQPTPAGFDLIDAAAVREKWGVPPEKIGEILTLTGDAVDNIPGVPGVGPKTAATWIQAYSTVDGLLAHLHELKSERHRQMLESSRDILARNRKLVMLREDLPLPRPIGELQITPDWAAQARLFAAYEFRGFLAEAQRMLGGAPAPEARREKQEKPPAPPTWSQGELL
ncbi:MAG: 5'-3' exonuclease H3TH domain-containing protein [Verrucomicrobium sp.]|nr:5'-3' exonuclease H3TH domain-containing protein [Verrucomicrobium sp.]